MASRGPNDVPRSVFPTFTEKRATTGEPNAASRKREWPFESEPARSNTILNLETQYEFPWDNTEHGIPWDKTDHGIPWDNLAGKDVEDVKLHLSLVAKNFNPFVLKLKAGEVEKAKKKSAVVIMADENDKVVAVLRS